MIELARSEGFLPDHLKGATMHKTLAARLSEHIRKESERSGVQDLIASLAEKPMPEAEARRRLAGGKAGLEDLIRLKLVRIDGGIVRLGFAYFTIADMALVHRAAADYAPRLAASYKSRRARFDAL